MIEKIKSIEFDERIFLDTLSIMLKTTFVGIGFISLLMIVYLLNNQTDVSYTIEYAKTQEQIRLDHERELELRN